MTDAVLRVKLLDPEAKAPTVAHPGSDLGFDLYALEDVVLEPGVMVRVRTGIAVEGPEGYGFVLGDRSSMAALRRVDSRTPCRRASSNTL